VVRTHNRPAGIVGRGNICGGALGRDSETDDLVVNSVNLLRPRS
jgi:hypothetical protein